MIEKIKVKLKKSNITRLLYHRLTKIYYKYCLTDQAFIEKYFKKNIGREVNLTNPKEFSDKIQWLKLNWYDPLAIKCVDKFEVRNIIKEKIGYEYLNELYAVYESIDEIDISRLPQSFVLKATHSSGHNFVCKNKNDVDWNIEFKNLKKWFEINYFWQTREWVYKDISPRIICEKYLSEDDETTALTDYKFYCFNGQPMYCQVIKDRETGGSIDFFDMEWNHMEFTGLQKMPHSNNPIIKPNKLQDMLDISKELSENFPFVRVDFYYVKGKVYFGELTFFPRSGFAEFAPQEWNRTMGDLLILPNFDLKN